MKTILITEATTTIGAAFARRFIKDGHKVIATGQAAALQALAGELGGNLLPMQLDMTDGKAVARFPDELPEEWRQIDVLVNNAELAFGLTPAWEADLGEWDKMIAMNCTGLIHVTRAILPGMVARNDGTILNLGCIASEYPHPGGHVFGATQAFVRQFSLNLREDLLGKNIRVTDIEPGYVEDSAFSWARFGEGMSKNTEAHGDVVLLSPEHIAEAASWILSLPLPVNINRIEMVPLCQGGAPLAVRR